MEFCGGHTVTIFKHGIRQLLPPTIEMLSGPGCPVCVTANADLDKAIGMAHLPDVIVTTFGDMLKVPGSYSSLQHAKAEGGDIRIVYSAQDALNIARDNASKSIIFFQPLLFSSHTVTPGPFPKAPAVLDSHVEPASQSRGFFDHESTHISPAG